MADDLLLSKIGDSLEGISSEVAGRDPFVVMVDPHAMASVDYFFVLFLRHAPCVLEDWKRTGDPRGNKPPRFVVDHLLSTLWETGRADRGLLFVLSQRWESTKRLMLAYKNAETVSVQRDSLAPLLAARGLLCVS